MRQDLPAIAHMLGVPGAPLLFLLLVFGMVCALAGIVRKKKSVFEKRMMLLFAFYVTTGIGAYAGWRVLARGPIWLVAFPAWNILNGLVLLAYSRAPVGDTECILDEKATFGQIVVTALVVFLLLTACRYLFELHWAVTYSIAVAYTMNVHSIIRLGRRLGPDPVSNKGMTK
jgi:hypothetical protein